MNAADNGMKHFTGCNISRDILKPVKDEQTEQANG